MKFLNLSMLAFVFLMLNAASCSKDNGNTLPPETQKGKNTFGFIVNGIVLLNKGQPLWSVKIWWSIISPRFFKTIC